MSKIFKEKENKRLNKPPSWTSMYEIYSLGEKITRGIHGQRTVVGNRTKYKRFQKTNIKTFQGVYILWIFLSILLLPGQNPIRVKHPNIIQMMDVWWLKIIFFMLLHVFHLGGERFHENSMAQQ